MSTLTIDEQHRLWLEDFKTIVQADKQHRFKIGDKLLELSEHWSNYKQRLEEAARVSGFKVSTLRDFRTTAGAIDFSLRTKNFSWSQWVAIGRLKKRSRWTGKVCPDLTREAVEELVAKTPLDTKVEDLRTTVKLLTDGPLIKNPNRLPNPRDKTVKVTVSLSFVDFLLNTNRLGDITLEKFVQVHVVDQFFVEAMNSHRDGRNLLIQANAEVGGGIEIPTSFDDRLVSADF